MLLSIYYIKYYISFLYFVTVIIQHIFKMIIFLENKKPGEAEEHSGGKPPSMNG